MKLKMTLPGSTYDLINQAKSILKGQTHDGKSLDDMYIEHVDLHTRGQQRIVLRDDSGAMVCAKFKVSRNTVSLKEITESTEITATRSQFMFDSVREIVSRAVNIDDMTIDSELIESELSEMVLGDENLIEEMRRCSIDMRLTLIEEHLPNDLSNKDYDVTLFHHVMGQVLESESVVCRALSKAYLALPLTVPYSLKSRFMRIAEAINGA